MQIVPVHQSCLPRSLSLPFYRRRRVFLTGARRATMSSTRVSTLLETCNEMGVTAGRRIVRNRGFASRRKTTTVLRVIYTENTFPTQHGLKYLPCRVSDRLQTSAAAFQPSSRKVSCYSNISAAQADSEVRKT